MVEQRSPMVAWLRKMVKRGNDNGDNGVEGGSEASPSIDGDISPVSSNEAVAGSLASRTARKSRSESESVSETASANAGAPPSVQYLDRHGTTSHLRQRLNLQDSASVMTIASSSKQRGRRSMDTNASTRALAAESVFSWDNDRELHERSEMSASEFGDLRSEASAASAGVTSSNANSANPSVNVSGVSETSEGIGGKSGSGLDTDPTHTNPDPIIVPTTPTVPDLHVASPGS